MAITKSLMVNRKFGNHQIRKELIRVQEDLKQEILLLCSAHFASN